MLALLMVLREICYMNNWDIITKGNPRITVLYKEPGIPGFAIGQILPDLMEDREHWESTTFRYEGDRESEFDVINDSDISAERLDSVMNCVRDHVDNINKEDLEISHYDQRCVTERHVKESIECYASMDDCIVVDIYESQYRADNVTVFIYYIRLA